MHKLILLIVIVTLCLSAQAGHLAIFPVFAESLSVSLRVGDTRIAFDGFTSPGAFVTIKQNASVIGTIVAGSDGNFSKTVDAYNPGIQTFELYATDSNSISTSTISYSVNLVSNTLTTIANIVFPPTIVLDPLTNTFSGFSHPLSDLTLVISDGTTYPITVDSDGSWSYLITSDASGSYTAYVIAHMPGNYLSIESEALTFTISTLSSATPTPSSIATSTSAAPATTSIETTPLAPSGAPKNQAPVRLISPSPLPTSPGIFNLGITRAISFINIQLILWLLLILLLIRLLFKKPNKKKR
ncbi:MAG: hypothetical protein WCG44_03720 [bacterium]